MKKPTYAAAFGLLLFALITSVICYRYPDVTTFRNLPPRLDSSTPSAQGDLELLAIVKTERNAYTLVLNAPTLPKINSNFQNPYSPSNAFYLKATSSLGQSWKVGWRLDSSNSSSYNTNDLPLHRKRFPDPMLLAELPWAYPPGCQWVDVEMADQSGHRARWRLTGLQTARNTVPTPKAQSNTYSRSDVFIRLDGQWRHWDSKSHQEWRGELSLWGCVTPNPKRKWKIEPTGAQSQWISYHERKGPTTPEERMGTFLSTLPPVRNANFSNARELCGLQLTGDYPTANQYGVFYFDLLEYEVSTNGKETLLSRTPLSLTAPFQDKGSQEKLYTTSFKSKY